MNGSGAIASGTTITATIGSNATADNANGAGMTYIAAGKINNGITFDGTDDSINTTYVQTNVSSFTVATWFKTNTGGNGVFWQDRGSGAGLSITLGIGNNPGGCAAGKISYGIDSNSIYIGKCTSSTYNDNTWHHVVGVWSGTSGSALSSGQFTIYVDGSNVAQTNTSVGTAPTAPISGLGNSRIGRHDAWGVNYAGSLDEMIVWNRALTANEVQQIYRRGGNNLKFQIKICSLSDCSDVATWKGYDNTSATYFSELNNNSIPTTGLGNPLTTYPVMTFSNFPSLVIPTSRYFQYQATLTSDVTTFQPEFTYVKLSAACIPGTQTFTVSGTFSLPANCTQMTVTAIGGGGASGRATGGGTKSNGGIGGKAVTTFTGLDSSTTFTVTVGTGGKCSGTAGTGAYAGGSGGAGAGNPGNGAAFGGNGGTGGSNNGGAGNIGGGGSGAGGGPNTGAGGGGSSGVSTGGTDWVLAGGGGASGGSQTGTAGAGGSACSGSASGDYFFGGNGGNGTSNSGSGGGGGGCYCLGGCTSATATGSAGGDTGGNACQSSNDGTDGSVKIDYQ
ncbi:MAG: LamG domain-containing protein [Pseudobdellovibrio sp.]